MENWGIRKKLTNAFGAIVAVVLCFSAFAVFQMSTINDKSTEIADNWLPSVRNVGEMKTSLAEQRLYAWRHITSTVPSDMQAAETLIARERQAFDKLRGSYEKLISSDEERRLYDSFAASFEDLERSNQAWLSLSRLNRNVEALTLFKGRTRELYDTSRERLAELAELNARGASQASVEGDELYSMSLMLTGFAVLLTLGLAIAAARFLLRTIAQPVADMTAAMSRLAGGDLAVEVPARDRRDEMGALAAAMDQFKQAALAERERAQKTLRTVERIGEALATLATGDLTREMGEEVNGEFAKIRADFNQAVARLRETVEAISERVESVRTASGEIEAASTDLASRTTRQAASLEETAAAVEELSATAKAAATSVAQVADGATSAQKAAEQGASVAKDAAAAMGAISDSSRKISDIVGLIDEIAFQTNLLALNAGVEAARAGDAGKGFAVVANEVRALAQRSADAAKNVKAIIQASSVQVESGVDLVGKSGMALEAIVAEAVRVSKLAADISVAVQQQSASVAEIGTAVADMNNGTQQNAAMVEETNATCVSLAREAVGLEEAISFFDTGQARGRRSAMPARQASAAAQPTGARALQAKLRTVGNTALKADEDDWSEF